jgi:photosystem II stability/assembly factor-like uncharacterized protein
MDANTIYTAGQAGVFMKSTDRGDTWKFNYQAGVPWYGIATRDVLCGQFLTKELGYLGGAVGMTKTTDGGNTFTNITPPGFPAASIFAIGFTDSLNGYVAGTGAYPFARTTDGGASWLQSSSAAPTTNRNMCVLNKNFIVVCGFPSMEKISASQPMGVKLGTSRLQVPHRIQSVQCTSKTR